jgi:hypothetical protein
MGLSLTIPQLFYDFIARVMPGFLFLFVLRANFVGTGIKLSPAATLGTLTSVGNLLYGFGFLVLCYFAGWILRSIRWPNLQPKESSEFRAMYQRVRLQHPESGFRIVKLRAEARLLEASRTGMFLVAGLTLAVWMFYRTELIRGVSLPHSVWALRVAVPALIGLIFLKTEPSVWRAYRGNVEALHSLIIDEGYPRQIGAGGGTATQPSHAPEPAVGPDSSVEPPPPPR